MEIHTPKLENMWIDLTLFVIGLILWTLFISFNSKSWVVPVIGISITTFAFTFAIIKQSLAVRDQKKRRAHKQLALSF